MARDRSRDEDDDDRDDGPPRRRSRNDDDDDYEGGGGGRGAPPKNYLVESILVTLFCCLPFGIAAIVNAAAVNSAWASGNRREAKRASEQAGKWVKWSIITGLIAIVISVVLQVVVLGGMAAALKNK